MATRIVECAECGQKNISKLTACIKCGADIHSPTTTAPKRYIGSNLLNGEKVVHLAKIHWIIFVSPITALIFGSLMMWVSFGGGSGSPNVSFTLLVPGFILAVFVFPATFGQALVTKLTTELGVTTKRVIAKAGLISRKTIELNHNKVESFMVNQSILGRLLGFGTVVIHGTGGGITPIAGIESPLEFRKRAMEIIDTN
jgi:uncharacterized membrane protein YdbT with pleckstrin-like domain